MKLTLGSLNLGEIENPIFCDQTWHGVLHLEPAMQGHPIGRRIVEYMSFCENWNKRLRDNPNNPPDSSEFGQFVELTESDEWHIEDDDSAVTHHVNAPLFLRGSSFVCRPWEFLYPE